jgi:hypothetical protein
MLSVSGPPVHIASHVHRCARGGASGEFCHVSIVELLNLAIHRDIGAPHVQEVLPRLIAIANHPTIGTLIEWVLLVNDVRPIGVALGERDRIAVAGALLRLSRSGPTARPMALARIAAPRNT